MISEFILKRGREKSLNLRHPWIFSGAIDRFVGSPLAGDTVKVSDATGAHRGYAAFSPRSQIRLRMWSFDPNTSVDVNFIRERLQSAISRRRMPESTAVASGCRLVNAESDGLPGLVADRYGNWVVCQFLSTGADHWKSIIADALMEMLPIRGVYERSDVHVRALEGLSQETGVAAGDPPPALIEIQEGACRLLVDVIRGHKTGFYLDQRDNRALVAARCEGKTVLNCFSYTGAFAVQALMGGATHVTNIDTAAGHLKAGEDILRLNGIPATAATHMTADVFQQLRRFASEKRRFDAVILDPPKFVDSKRHLQKACRGYKDINRLAAGLLSPDGCLFTFSCSGLMPADLFQKVVADAWIDAQRPAQILKRLNQAEDHPVATSFPEGAYLKGLLCQAIHA